MNDLILYTVLNGIGGLLGLLGFIVSLVCVAIVVGMMRSTHTVVPYRPVDDDLHDVMDELEAGNEKEQEYEDALMRGVGRKKKNGPPTPATPPVLDIDPAYTNAERELLDDLDEPLREINNVSTMH